MYIGGFLSSLCLKKINHWLGRKITFIIGALIGICGCIWIKFGYGSEEEYKGRDISFSFVQKKDLLFDKLNLRHRKNYNLRLY